MPMGKGRTFVVYTTQPCGLFKINGHVGEKEFRQAVQSGVWDETPNDEDVPRGRDLVKLHYIALLTVEDDFDFYDNQPRPEATWPSYLRDYDEITTKLDAAEHALSIIAENDSDALRGPALIARQALDEILPVEALA